MWVDYLEEDPYEYSAIPINRSDLSRLLFPLWGSKIGFKIISFECLTLGFTFLETGDAYLALEPSCFARFTSRSLIYDPILRSRDARPTWLALEWST